MRITISGNLWPLSKARNALKRKIFDTSEFSPDTLISPGSVCVRLTPTLTSKNLFSIFFSREHYYLTVVLREIWNNLEMVEKNALIFLKFQSLFIDSLVFLIFS